MFVKPAAIVSALSSTTSVSATERTMSCCYDIQKPARPTSVRVPVELARGILEVDQDTIQLDNQSWLEFEKRSSRT